MKIIIVGCGKVGSTIAEQLNLEGHDITIVDIDDSVVTDVANHLDIMGICGNGATYSIQMEAGVEDADLLIAVTESDELNLLCCMVAKKAGDCDTIARVRNPQYTQDIAFIKEELGLAMVINPEFAAATEMARLLRIPSAIDIDTFARGRVELLEFKLAPGNILCEKSLMDISRTIRLEVLVCAVERGDQVIIPNGSFVLKAGDVISIVTSSAHSRAFFEKIGLYTNEVRDCLIVGGGKIAYYLAKQLIETRIHVKIVERDGERCESLSEQLPQAVIIRGDATNKDVLLEEGIETCSSFVSLTGIDEENIFLSLYAKNVSRAKIVTKINRISFDDIIEGFDLGSLIYPKYITAEYIVRYVRALQNGVGSNVRTLYKIIHNKAEALEFVVRKDCPLIGQTLEALNLKPDILLACIIRKMKVIIPNGQSVLKEKDSIVVVTTRTGLDDITDIVKD